MIDTHCHLTFEGLRERVDEVIAAAADAGVDRMITVGTTPDTSQEAIALADRYENVFATAGLHPGEAASWTDKAALVEPLREMLSHPKVVALGEMGLDTHHPHPHMEDQRRVFQWQLELMAEMSAESQSRPWSRNVTCVIHNRGATEEVLAMIRASGLPGEWFVFHCFSVANGRDADAELDHILELGAMVSFTGIITFKNAQELATASDHVSLEKLMIETDSPFLTPEPHRKIRPNEPRYVVDVARFLAVRRDMTLEELTDATDTNARRFFGLPPHRRVE